MKTREDCTQNDMVIDGYDIATWYSDGVDAPYLAVNMTVARKVLSGYRLSDSEQSDVMMLMAGYCRIVEERGLTGYGDTELEAIADLFLNSKRRG
jgi:hypothetical protein